jgi:hypothetical protein
VAGSNHPDLDLGHAPNLSEDVCVISKSRALVYGTLAVGLLDILDAILVFGLRSGATPKRIFQSIAVGVLGRSSYDHGWWSAALGCLLHFVIACGVAGAYLGASRLTPVLARKPWIFGPLYGLAVYLTMYFVVLPISRVGPTHPAGFGLANGLLIHIFGVGLPAALIASRAR